MDEIIQIDYLLDHLPGTSSPKMAMRISPPHREKQKADPELGNTVIEPLVKSGVDVKTVKTNWGNALGMLCRS